MLLALLVLRRMAQFDIIASQGSYNIKVEIDQNLLQYVETVVENGRLIVRFKKWYFFVAF